MRTNLILSITALCAATTVALSQQPNSVQLKDVAEFRGGEEWIRFLPDQNIKANAFFPLFKKELGLGDNDQMEIFQQKKDQIGFTHHRFQQHYKGIPVEWAIYLIHEKENRTVSANGHWVKGIQMDVAPAISGEEAIQKALNATNASEYMWQRPVAETMKKKVDNDVNATFYPEPELIIFDEQHRKEGTNYRLAWKMDIYAASPSSREWVYIDAQNGTVLYSLNQIHDGDVQAVAETRYSGTQTMTVDSVGPTSYRLRDYSRGSGVETFDMKTQTSDFIPAGATDFVDSDNYWNNANVEHDDVAGDVHWGTGATYDYYFNEHGFDSYDGNGKLMVSYVHVGVNWFNARFTGDWMEYGDGSGTPLTSLDVVGHEITHGVTRNTAGLVYAYESGALNESFSDIFGTTIEFFNVPAQATWVVGDVGFSLRDMSNPNFYNHPDTYLGQNWWTAPSDNGGVHTNSGVQNFWYYLLSEGGSGTNDIGTTYNVAGLGMSTAAAIAFRNLSQYLTPNSGYFDARQGSIRAAEDIYGPCSPEVMQVILAWNAVGVGLDTTNQDVQINSILSPNTACGLTSTEDVTITFMYHYSGCGDSIVVGDSIELGYRVNGGPAVSENMIAGTAIHGGDTITYTFSTPADLSVPGQYSIDAWANYIPDLQRANDSIFSYELVNPVMIANNLITFEDPANVLDSLYMVTNLHSRIATTQLESSTGTFSILMTGDDPDHHGAFVMPSTESEIFTLNPDYLAQQCYCVDATNWNSANAHFDMKQTYSKWYLEEYGFDLPLLASSLRVMANGNQIGSLYHPTTYFSDPFVRHYLNLDAYAGTQFELCFETMNFVKREEDPVFGSKGDNAYLDNIFISELSTVAIEEYTIGVVSIFPNPSATGQFNVNYEALKSETIELEITDVLGKVLHSTQMKVRQGNNALQVNLDATSKGMYLLHIKTKGGQKAARLLVN
jgi:Zn-dependent metalloprotease